MCIAETYISAYEQLEKVIEKRKEQGRFPAMGYTSNLDLLCDFHIERLNDLLERYLPGQEMTGMKTVKAIRTVAELLETIVYFCSRGIGGEADIDNLPVIMDAFKWKNGMGGTAVQAAMALSAVGCPSIVHLTDDSREVCELLDTPEIYTVNEGGELIHTNQVIQSHEQEIHFIIQFQKGDCIRLGRQELEIPVSNRLIITKITVNEFVPFSKPYFRYIEHHAETISSNVLSSFNALLDEHHLLERLNYVKNHIKNYMQANPQGITFFEDAHYHNMSVRRLCLETIYSQVDIVSLNEEELANTLQMYEFPVDMEDILSCIRGVKYMKEKFRVRRGVIVHTKDYSMYVGVSAGLNLEQGLIYGNLLATAKAKHGSYGNREQIKELLALPLSEKGVRCRAVVAASEFAGETILVPTKYIDKPKYTIGLGDSFVAGVQICF